MLTKKYVVFVFDSQYPNGGLNDRLGSYNTLEDCIKGIKLANYFHFQIVDASTWEIIEEGTIEGLGEK